MMGGVATWINKVKVSKEKRTKITKNKTLAAGKSCSDYMRCF
jgi:hypothetical protein